MSTKRQPKQQAQTTQSNWKGFVNISLPAAEKDRVLKNAADSDGLLNAVAELASAGFRVSLSFDHNTDTFTASATGTDYALQAVGYSVSAKSLDPTSALAALYHKVAVLAEFNLVQFAANTREAVDL